jgi:enhancer of polycomb-like protein
MKREVAKQDVSSQGQQVWEKRLAVVELKRKYPTLGVKEDDELLYDKERVVKRAKMENGTKWVDTSTVF